MYIEKGINEAIKLAIITAEPVKVEGTKNNIVVMSEEGFNNLKKKLQIEGQGLIE